MRRLLGHDNAEEWASFLSFHEQVFDYKPGDVILSQGEPVKGIYSIIEGKVKVVIQDGDGERLLRLAANGDLLGHRGLGGDWRYPISSIALVATRVTFLPLAAFNAIARTNAVFVHNLMMFLAEELRASEHNQLQMPVLNRISRTLLMNYQAFGFETGTTRLGFTIARKDMASHASTTYESVIRSLSDLSKRGVIGLKGKGIAIHDLVGLKVLAEGGEP